MSFSVFPLLERVRSQRDERPQLGRFLPVRFQVISRDTSRTAFGSLTGLQRTFQSGMESGHSPDRMLEVRYF
ncbi:hypothetical protein FGU71_08485 [Erythrobacter insulae]|uniref:Uncharacterized protein n=1 Tax=Erythrobacter insulae TaxID=2584124 RepID=A0A547PCL7_9SPHN|nr:hypothetical protein [Erythrobacter insulae]TRD11888.1 hypothetical protein FGU71_08485 [Erythrobacter insulae]